MLKEVQNDILTGLDLLGLKHTLILHGCNCRHTMNSGIARYLRSQFPVIHTIDRQTEFGDKAKLGTYSRADITHSTTILNCYTQYNYGTHTIQVDYDAIDRCLDSISHDFSGQVWNIRMPRIGCGLAGGDWKIVKELVKENLGEFNVTVYSLFSEVDNDI